MSVGPFFVCWKSYQVHIEQNETAGEGEHVMAEAAEHNEAVKETVEKGCIVGSLGTDTPFWLSRIRGYLRHCISSLHVSISSVKWR